MQDLSSTLAPPRRARRRAWLAMTAAAVCLSAGMPRAVAMEPPAGPVILSVTGKVPGGNAPDGAHFDLAMLEKLPRQTFSTKTPWFAQPRRFTGVLLRDLLAAVGSGPAKLGAVALNDYRVEIPEEDVARGGAMLAYLVDDKPMSVREKGPLVIIYPFDDRPELRSAVHYSRAIWQLRSLDIR